MASKRSVLFITGHSFLEPQRVSVHFMALAAAEAGYDVRIFVAGVGVSALMKSPEICRSVNPDWIATGTNIHEYITWQLTTPADLRSKLLNTCVSPLASLYGRVLPNSVREVAERSTGIIVESGVAAPYMQALSRGGLTEKTIYLAADDIRTIRAHPTIRKRTAEFVTNLRGCLSFGAHQSDTFLGQTSVVVVPKGIDLHAFRKVSESPYNTIRPTIVSVGNMLFDSHFLEIAQLYPTADWHFIGRIEGRSRDNVFIHGPMEFAKTISFIQHASVGLLPYRPAPGMEYLRGSSMKLAQYRACGLPVVGPEQLDDGLNYHPFASSTETEVILALEKALAAGKSDSSSPGTDFRDNWASLERML